MVELLRPVRGGFLRPFGCGWFIREFLLGNGPYGSPKIDPEVGAPQADIFYHYKMGLMKATALDRATRVEEKRARREKRPINPDNIDRLAKRYLARMPYKTQGCRFHSFVVYFSTIQRLGIALNGGLLTCPPKIGPLEMRDSCRITIGGSSRENKKVYGGADISDSPRG